MKIMQVIPALGMGGAEKVLEHLVRCQSKNGDEVIVVTFYDEKSPVYEAIQKMNITNICLHKVPGIDISIIAKLKRIIRAYEPDIIHTHLYAIPYVFLASGKKPIVHTVHSIASKEQDNRTRPLCQFIYRSKKCTVVAINEYVRNSLIEEYHMQESRLKVVYNGVDLYECMPKSEYDNNGKLRIISVASLIPLKNHRLMIEAVKILKDQGIETELYCLGGGCEKENLISYSKEMNVFENVKFLGIIENVYPYLHSADVFILPSQYEGVPMSLIEAMGTGLPVIVTNRGGTVNMIKNGVTGILIDPSSKELSEALKKLANDAALRQKIGEEAYKASKTYSSDKMRERYEDIYLSRLQ